MNNSYYQNNRTFQNLDSVISGKSVVVERESILKESNDTAFQDLWPYSLTDYLKSFIGRTIQLEYVLPGGRYLEKRGELVVAGSNFIGIRLNQTNDLFLLEMDSIKSVNIINYQGKSYKKFG